MNTKALRQKILDLAIHGKLVPQDPNDEPASVLLERIKAEKERLIKEGKIKRTKRSKAACDKPHYPFELPDGWKFCCINDIAESLLGKTLDKSKDKGVPKEYLCAINVQWGKFDFSTLKSFLIGENEFQRYSVRQGDLMVCEGGDVGRCAIWEENEREMYYQNALHRIRCEYGISNYFLQYVFWYYKLNGTIDYLCKGVTIKHFTQTTMSKLAIPLPPSNEQKRIVNEIQRLFSIIDKVEERKDDLQLAIRQTKSKILDLAIHGKLVPQDPNDEPASELLKRINPKAEIACDNPHYRNQPKGWAVCRLEDIVEYEQPTAYIVSSTDYDDSYPTPVLTAGKSFLIGHTNDEEGIFSNLPCIIFDDFTTDSKLVNFPFKVKSSAMKILKVHKNVDIEYVASFMSITRLIGDTHKRYWISEYSKLEIPLPPYKEQVRIKNQIKLLFERLDSITECL